jgi:hypothetical protein
VVYAFPSESSTGLSIRSSNHIKHVVATLGVAIKGHCLVVDRR